MKNKTQNPKKWLGMKNFSIMDALCDSIAYSAIISPLIYAACFSELYYTIGIWLGIVVLNAFIMLIKQTLKSRNRLTFSWSIAFYLVMFIQVFLFFGKLGTIPIILKYILLIMFLYSLILKITNKKGELISLYSITVIFYLYILKYFINFLDSYIVNDGLNILNIILFLFNVLWYTIFQTKKNTSLSMKWYLISMPVCLILGSFLVWKCFNLLNLTTFSYSDLFFDYEISFVILSILGIFINSAWFWFLNSEDKNNEKLFYHFLWTCIYISPLIIFSVSFSEGFGEIFILSAFLITACIITFKNNIQKQSQKNLEKKSSEKLIKKVTEKSKKESLEDEEYLNKFSWMGFFFPAITCLWSNQKGKGIGLLILKIFILIFVVLSNHQVITHGNSGVRRLGAFIVFIFSILGIIVGRNIRKKLYETGKYGSIEEFKSFMKKRTKLMVTIGIMTTLGLPIILLGLYLVVFIIAVAFTGWR